MAIENTKNRDLFFKAVLTLYLMHILSVMGIKEELKEILSTEIISMEIKDIVKIFNNLTDLRILTKSGKVILFECKKYTIRKSDLKQLYENTKRVECDEKRKVIPILITISKKGKIKKYKDDCFIFRPIIFKTKSYIKQKDLNTIREKLEHNKMLTAEECSLLVTSPIYTTDSSESDLVKEVCYYIKNKKNCISDSEYRKMVIPMYLNIVEYIDDENDQKRLMEVIDLTGETRGLFAELREEGRNDGLIEGEIMGKRKLLESQLERYSIEDMAQINNMSVSEIRNILNSRF